MTCTLVVEVWSQDSSGYETRADCFDSLSNACCYAVANANKIAYGVPRVSKVYYYYDEQTETVRIERIDYSEQEVRNLAENRRAIRAWGRWME